LSIAVRHVGLGFGRIEHWYDGLGEFSLHLGLALAEQAPVLRREQGLQLHYHLPRRWHGRFGSEVSYLDTNTLQRWVHTQPVRFALWHCLHQHNRLRAPAGTQRRLETVHDLNFLHLKQGGKIEKYRRRVTHRWSACDALVAITRHVAGDIAREVPGLRAPVQVIYNGVTDLTTVAQTPLAGVGEQPYLLHISRMAPSKNIVALLDLAAAWPEQRLVLAGATSTYIDEVRQQVSARSLRNVTIHLDISEAQKAWLYAHCTGFVFPSLAEGFGLPPLEAMHFGKPVFLSRLTSLPEVGGDAAHYFDSFDGAAMRALIEAGLAAHQASGCSAAVAAHARRFSWERCARAHVALYRTLVPTA
jgi:glycosyltransferase involved in cell wall biosynthesis